MGDLLYNKYNKYKKFGEADSPGDFSSKFKVQGSKLMFNGGEGSKQNITTSSIRRQGPDRHECPLAGGKLDAGDRRPGGADPLRGRARGCRSQSLTGEAKIYAALLS